MAIDVGKLFIYSPNTSKTIAKVWSTVTDGDSVAETDDFLFGVFEIASDKNYYLEILNVLVLEIEKIYYQNKIDNHSLSPEQIFENSLKDFNGFLTKLIEQKKLPVFDTPINFLVGMISHNQLFFSHLGEFGIMLFHPNKTGQYQTIDVLNNNTIRAANTLVNLSKIFDNIIAGQLVANDHLIFCNNSILDFLSIDKIKQVVIANSPDEAVNQLRNVLWEASVNSTFAGLIIKISPEIITVKNNDHKETTVSLSHGSIEQLRSTEARTEKILSPSIISGIKKIWLEISGHLGQLTQKLFLPNRRDKKTFTGKIRLLIFNLLNAGKIIIYLIGRLVYKIYRAIKWCLLGLLTIGGGIKNLTNSTAEIINISQEPTNKTETISRGLNRTLNKFSLKKPLRYGEDKITAIINWFKKLKLSRQLLLVLATILILVFCQSIPTLIASRDNSAEQAQYADLLRQIQTKQVQIEGLGIYNNNKNIKQILLEIEELIKQIPRQTATQTQTADRLLAETELKLEELRKITRINNPKLIGSFPNETNNLLTNYQSLFSITPDGKKLMAINLPTNEIRTLPLENNQQFNELKFYAFDENVGYFYHDQKGLIKLDLTKPTKTLQPLEIRLSPEEKNITTIGIYNKAIYTTNPDTGKIFRHLPTLTGFGQPLPWLKDLVDLKNISSMAIDGFMYILYNNGEIKKIYTGKTQQFSFNDVEPALTAPTKIKTLYELKRLYILEPATKRLIITDKNGNLIIQYTADQFNNLKDLAISKDEKKIYLLNGHDVYEVEVKE